MRLRSGERVVNGWQNGAVFKHEGGKWKIIEVGYVPNEQ